MPGMYPAGRYDLAGFSVGVVERAHLLTGGEIKAGDVLVGLASSGPHSNGYSLIRKVIDGLDLKEHHGLPRPLGEILLQPTHIYVKQMLELRGIARGFVHITGGGFLENIPRVLPSGLGAQIKLGSWEVPPIFPWLADRGELSSRDLYRTFNMGIGMVVVVAEEDVSKVRGGVPIGVVVNDEAEAVALS